MSKTVVELLACWQGNFGHHRNGVIWMVVPHCLMWCIWQERNNQCFENSERTIAGLKLFFFKTLLDWMSIIESHSISSVYDLTDACNLCIWLCWSPAVYFLYTRWRIIKFLNKISFTYQKKKKKGYLYKVVNCVNWVNLGLIGHAWEGRSHHHCMQRPEQQRSHLAARQSLQLMMVRVLESDLGWEENVLEYQNY